MQTVADDAESVLNRRLDELAVIVSEADEATLAVEQLGRTEVTKFKTVKALKPGLKTPATDHVLSALLPKNLLLHHFHPPLVEEA